MKRRSVLAAAVAVLLLLTAALSSCTVFEDFSPESLLKSPKLTGADAQIQAVFEEAVGTNVVLVNPVSGDYRTSYLRYDVDKDGAEEILVFYAKEESRAELHIHFLKQSNGAWYSVGDVSGSGSEIYRIEFCDLDQNAGDEIVVTWTVSDSRRNKTLSVYRLAGGNQIPRIPQLVALQVFDYLLLDVDRDGQTELIYFFDDSTDPTKPFTASLIKYVSDETPGFRPLCQVQLSEDVEAPERVTFDKRSDHCCVYVDCRRADGRYMTEILDYVYAPKVSEADLSPDDTVAPPEGSSEPETREAQPEQPAEPAPESRVLLRPIAEDGAYLCEQTLRASATWCEIDESVKGENEPQVLIPAMREYAGSVLTDVEGREDTPMYYISYERFDGAALSPSGRAVFCDPGMRWSFRLDMFLGIYAAVYDQAEDTLSFFSPDSRKKPVLTVNFPQYKNGDVTQSIVISDSAPEWITGEAVRKMIKIF
ncbi:MAG: hypothetical protein IK104_00780 [Clostridia bacterium]|nr:hypothetical protein [Clostridia bacterium]